MKLFPLAAAALVLSLTGCASISVRNTQNGNARAKTPPAVVYVADYDTTGGDWKITSRSLQPDQYKEMVANLLADELVKDLGAYLKVPVKRVGKSKTPPPNGWLVTGHFTRVSEGNPAERIVVGMGWGGTKLETQTTVLDGSVHAPILRFETTGGSNASPGMLLSSGPGGVVVNGVSQAMRGMKDDAKRTSRQITASLLQYEVDKGWIKSAGLKVKKLGEFQLLQPLTRPKAPAQ